MAEFATAEAAAAAGIIWAPSREAWREDLRAELDRFFSGSHSSIDVQVICRKLEELQLRWERGERERSRSPSRSPSHERCPSRDIFWHDQDLLSPKNALSRSKSGSKEPPPALSLAAQQSKALRDCLAQLPSEEHPPSSGQPSMVSSRRDRPPGSGEVIAIAPPPMISTASCQDEAPFKNRHARPHLTEKVTKHTKAKANDSGGRRNSFSSAAGVTEGLPRPRRLSLGRDGGAASPIVPQEALPRRALSASSRPPSCARPSFVEPEQTSMEQSPSDDRKYPWQRSKSGRVLDAERNLSQERVMNDDAGFLERFVESAAFDYMSATLILLNAAFIGAQTDVMAGRDTTVMLPEFRAVEVVFATLFTVELICRLIVHKLSFFVSKDWRWNCFDTLLIVMQWLEEIMAAVAYDTGMDNFSTLRILRILRLIRIIRLVRVLRLIGELRSIVVSIIGSMRSLCWTILLLLGVMYVVGVYLTQMTSDHLHLALSEEASEAASEANQQLRHYYGSIGSSLLTLFQAITGGLNWHMITSPLMDAFSPWLSLVICSYIAFCLFALMNIVTGVFVESALQTAKSDRDMFMLHFVRQLFAKADADNAGYLTWDKFKATLDSDEMNMYFEAMDLDIDEAKDLFRLLDADGSGTVDFDEFVNGCFRLRGSAKAIDLAAFMAEYSTGRKQFEAFAAQVEATMNWTVDVLASVYGSRSCSRVTSGRTSLITDDFSSHRPARFSTSSMISFASPPRLSVNELFGGQLGSAAAVAAAAAAAAPNSPRMPQASTPAEAATPTPSGHGEAEVIIV